MKKSIATVPLSGMLREKLEAVAAAGFRGVEIFENDLRSKNVSLWQQGDIHLVVNAETDSFAHEYQVVRGPSVCALGLHVAPDFSTKLRQHHILYDRNGGDDEFFHVYTAAVAGHLFFEVVERRNYDGFGANNAPIRLAAQARMERTR